MFDPGKFLQYTRTAITTGTSKLSATFRATTAANFILDSVIEATKATHEHQVALDSKSRNMRPKTDNGVPKQGSLGGAANVLILKELNKAKRMKIKIVAASQASIAKERIVFDSEKAASNVIKIEKQQVKKKRRIVKLYCIQMLLQLNWQLSRKRSALRQIKPANYVDRT